MNTAKSRRDQALTKLALVITAYLAAFLFCYDLAHPAVFGWKWNLLRHGIGLIVIGWMAYSSFAEPPAAGSTLITDSRFKIGNYEIRRSRSRLSIHDSKDKIYLPAALILDAMGYLKPSHTLTFDALLGAAMLVLCCLMLLMGIFWRSHCEYDQSRGEFTQNGKHVCRLKDIAGVSIKKTGQFSLVRLSVPEGGKERAIPLFPLFANEDGAHQLAGSLRDFLGLAPAEENLARSISST